MTTRRERMERRAERRREWAAGRAAKATAAFDKAHEIADRRPLGQPILVGHHSEARHRRDIKRTHAAEESGVEHATMAVYHTERAEGIEHQLERSIYSDDPDAVDQLRMRIAGLAARRDRMKAINKEIKRGDGWAVRIEPPLTEEERRDLEMAAQFSGTVGYPGYALSNIGANIRRQQKRLDALATAAEPPTA